MCTSYHNYYSIEVLPTMSDKKVDNTHVNHECCNSVVKNWELRVRGIHVRGSLLPHQQTNSNIKCMLSCRIREVMYNVYRIYSSSMYVHEIVILVECRSYRQATLGFTVIFYSWFFTVAPVFFFCNRRYTKLRWWWWWTAGKHSIPFSRSITFVAWNKNYGNKNSSPF